MQLRAFKTSDIAALAALQPRYSEGWLAAELTDPGRAGGRNVLIVADGNVRAGAGFVPADANTYVAPSIVADMHAGSVLFEALLAAHHARGQAGFVRVSAFPDEVAKAAALERLGFVRTFAFITLARSTYGVVTAATSSTRVALTDVAATDMRRVHNLAFENVPNSPEQSLDEIQYALDRCLPDASGAWIDAGEIAGYVWIMRDGDHASVDAIGVAPTHRGRGLGRDMLAHALAHLASAGIAEARALIASSNVASLALHRAAGFDELTAMRRDVWQWG